MLAGHKYEEFVRNTNPASTFVGNTAQVPVQALNIVAGSVDVFGFIRGLCTAGLANNTYELTGTLPASGAPFYLDFSGSEVSNDTFETDLAPYGLTLGNGTLNKPNCD